MRRLPPPVLRPARVSMLVAALVALAAGAALLGLGASAPPAFATVTHRDGFEATVLGWTSWYGSYDLGPLGAGWCIDHGLRLLTPPSTTSPPPPPTSATTPGRPWRGR